MNVDFCIEHLLLYPTKLSSQAGLNLTQLGKIDTFAVRNKKLYSVVAVLCSGGQYCRKPEVNLENDTKPFHPNQPDAATENVFCKVILHQRNTTRLEHRVVASQSAFAFD